MKIERFAVIGHPIGHTMSPFIHKKLFNLNGYSVEYDVLDIENVEKDLEIIKKYDGINVTIPHKSNIIPFLQKITTDAKRFGSVNTVKNENNSLLGYSTDGEGCIKAIENSGVCIENTVVILGSGGAARAIAYAIEAKNVEIIIAARDINKAKNLADELKNAKAMLISDCDKIGKYNLLINATSVGMYPKIDNCPVADSVISNCSSIFDAVYNPHETVLIQKAISMNKKIVYGIDMLVYQAVKAHEHWYGGTFDVNDINTLCKEAEMECKRLFR